MSTDFPADKYSIMRARDFVTEAKGLFGRKIGDQFADDNGNVVSFGSVEMFPSATPNDAYPDERAMITAYSQITKGTEADQVNVLNKMRNRAFAIARLSYEDGSEELWVKWFIKVPMNLMGAWANKETPPGWQLQTKTAKKARSGMTPQDLIRTDNKFSMDPAAIIERVRSLNADPAIIAGLQQMADGDQYANFEGLGDQLEAVRDHLAEIYVPIALAMGYIGGDAEIARQSILNADWSSCQVNWPQAKNTNLIDSVITAPNGATLGISNKGDKGAKASVGNIFTAMMKAMNDAPELVEQHQDMVNLVTTINQQSAKEGPLLLGTQLGIISEELANEIRGLLKQVTQDTSNLSDEATELFNRYGSRAGSVGYSIGNVLLANCAKSVASAVNIDTRFSAACLAFLNQASIVQIYTSMSNEGGVAVVDGYRAKFPPNYSGKVIMDAGKNYTSTEVKGKFAFDIN